jgi:hypothetical protein
MSQVTRRLVTVVVALSLAVGSVMASVSPAGAAGEQYERCTTWQQITEVQNRTSWARVSERACIQWINYGNRVRPVGQLRIDWPIPCTLGDCDFKAIKLAQMSFDKLWIGVGWNFHGEQGTQGWDYVKGPYRWNGGSYVLDVYTDWKPHPLGTYSAKAAMVVDLDNDGQGATAFEPTSIVSVAFQ